MARIRSIKPQAFTSESLAEVSVHARWTFAGLWTYVDDEGRGKADPRLIKGQIWPLDDDVTSKDVASYIDELEAGGMVCRYEVDGRTYLHVVRWHEHQSINKSTRSKLPCCPTHSPNDPAPDPYEGCPPDLREPYRSPTGEVEDAYAGEQGTGSKEQGVRSEEETSSSPTADAVDDEQPAPPSKPDKNDRDDVRELCNLMVELVVANGSKRPNITKAWQDDARLLIDKDGRDLRKALELMRWTAGNTFWRANVQCIPTFRDKYDQLRLKALEEWEREQREREQEARGNVRALPPQAPKSGSGAWNRRVVLPGPGPDATGAA